MAADAGSTNAHTAGLATPSLAVKALLFGVLLLLSGLWQGFDFFGQATQRDENGAELSVALVDPLIAAIGGTPNRDSAPGDRITVLTFDSDTQARYRFDTPFMPYALQARFIHDLVKMRARAIFLDLSYNRDDDTSDPNLEAFGHALDEARNAGVPVYTGPIRPGSQAWMVMHDKVTQVAIAWRSPDHALDYPATGLSNRPTAAFAIYHDICDPKPCGLAGQTPHPVFVQWPSYISEDTPTLKGDPCAHPPATRFQAFQRIMKRNILHRADPDGSNPSRKCILTRGFPLQALYKNAVFPDTQFGQGHIDGRMVMIGDGLHNDTFIAPVHGQINGVFHHAMALENLLAHGGDYQVWPTELKIGAFALPLNFLAEWLLKAAVAAASLVILHLLPRVIAGQEALYLAFGALWGAVALGLCFAVSCALVALLRWPSINLFSVLPFSAAFTIVTEPERLLKYLLSGKGLYYALLLVAGAAVIAALVVAALIFVQ